MFPLLLKETLGVLFHILFICFIVMLSVYFMIPHFRCERFFSNSARTVYLHVYIQTRITSFLLQRQVCVLESMTIQGVSWCIELFTLASEPVRMLIVKRYYATSATQKKPWACKTSGSYKDYNITLKGCEGAADTQSKSGNNEYFVPAKV